MMSRLTVSLFGSISASVDGVPIENFYYDKVRALLAYLVIESDRTHRREWIAGLLWPESTERNARQNLSQALYKLRAAIRDDVSVLPFIEVASSTLSFAWTDDCELDTRSFATLLLGCQEHHPPKPSECEECRRQFQQAVSLYHGDFMTGFSLVDCSEFENWMLMQREHYRQMVIETLASLSSGFEECHEYENSLKYARHWLDLDAWDEAAYRHMMRSLAKCGQRAKALEQYEVCRRILNEELDVEPSAETTELYRQLRTGEAGHSPRKQIAKDVIFMAPQLPAQGVVGRDNLLEQVVEKLEIEDEHPPATEYRTNTGSTVVALQGMAGIGKTSVALALAHMDQMAVQFPDGILWASVGPTPIIRNILDDWGKVLGIDLVSERDEQACADRLRSVLHHKRILLIIDDVWEIFHGNYLTLSGPYCRTVITTRETPIAHALATRKNTIQVDVLRPEDAHTLLVRLAPAIESCGEHSIRLLCERLEYLPLALTLAGRMLANESDVPSRMKRLVDELIEQRESRLQLLQTEGRTGLGRPSPVSLEAILGLSVERLDNTEQTRFALLTVFGSEPLVWEIEAAAHVWQCPVKQAENTVSNLIQRGLVARRQNQYWMHALLADYAHGLLQNAIS